MVGLLELDTLDGLILMFGTLAGMVGKLESLSPHCLSSVFEPKLFPMVAEYYKSKGVSYTKILRSKLRNFHNVASVSL